MKPRASLSLDADNQWSYMKIHGDDGWESFPSYLDVLAPRALEVLDRHDLRITFFLVGQDAARPENADALASLAAANHEIGNHSFRHEPWLHRYSDAELDEELARAEAAIEAATGVHTTGFRGPGYSLSATTLRVLVRRGYAYDASTLPTYIGPLALRLLLPHRGPHRGAAGRARAAVRDVVRRSARGAPVPLAGRRPHPRRAPGHDVARTQDADPRQLPPHVERVLTGGGASLLRHRVAHLPGERNRSVDPPAPARPPVR